MKTSKLKDFKNMAFIPCFLLYPPHCKNWESTSLHNKLENRKCMSLWFQNILPFGVYGAPAFLSAIYQSRFPF